MDLLIVILQQAENLKSKFTNVQQITAKYVSLTWIKREVFAHSVRRIMFWNKMIHTKYASLTKSIIEL